MGTVLGDLIAQLSGHALSSTPTEGGTAIAADPPRLGRLRHGGPGGGGPGAGAEDATYTAGKDKDQQREAGGRRYDRCTTVVRQYQHGTNGAENTAGGGGVDGTWCGEVRCGEVRGGAVR